MNNKDEVILSLGEDGVWGIKEKPYCTIEVATKEDYEVLQKALEKQIPKKPVRDRGYVLCPNCKKVEIYWLDKYCHGCGQRLDWSVE